VDNITSLSQTESSRFELRKYVEIICLISILVEQAIQLKKNAPGPQTPGLYGGHAASV
jgi:hypothetical protein